MVAARWKQFRDPRALRRSFVPSFSAISATAIVYALDWHARSASVILIRYFCMSQAAVGQRSAQRPQWRQTSSSLTMTRPVLRPSST